MVVHYFRFTALFFLLSWLCLLSSNMEACESLHLTEKEADLVEIGVANLKEDQSHFDLCPVGSLWTHTSFNVGAFKNNIAQVWRLQHSVEIKDLGKNLFSFQFRHWKDKERVLAGKPWWFDKKVLCLQEIPDNERHRS